MLLYHYCSNAAFLSIVEKKQLWASDLSLTNDDLEGKWLIVVLENLLARNERTKPHVDILLRIIMNFSSNFGALGVCFTEDGGDHLSQWRGYADDGRGVSIGFDLDALSALKMPDEDTQPRLAKVVYERNDQEKMVADWVARLSASINTEVEDHFSEIQTRQKTRPIHVTEVALIKFYFRSLPPIEHLYEFKNPAFKEERERRLIFQFRHETAFRSALEFDSRTDCIKRRLPFSFDRRAIKEIVVGPKNNTPEPVMRLALDKFGYPDDVKLRSSTASYR